MSSGYKIKGHQRSRSAKPYERKTGLVNRVKEWLTPSSWLNSWNKSSSDATGPSELELELEQRLGATQREDDNMPSLSHSASPLFVPRPGALRNPFLSNPMALLGVPGSQPEPSDVNRTLGEAPPTSVGVVSSRNGSPHSTSNAFHSGTGMESRPRSLASVPLSLRGSGVPSGPTSMANAREDFKMMTDASSSKDSEGSWVAEDDGSMEQEKDDSVSSDGRDQSSEQPRTKSFPTTLNLSGETERSEVYTYELGEGSAGVVQPAMCVTPVVVTEAEQAILQVENPAAKSPPPTPSSPPSSCTTPPATTTVTASADGRRTMLSSSLLNRLYTTNPFAMSTPQLSPVHETREENVHRGFAPKLPVSHSGSDGTSGSQFHSQTSILSSATADSSLRVPLPAMSTPSKFHTEESLKRSPFHSPFYSGRTSFGGAASGQKIRVKRPRTESSPPVVTPLRLSITARPVRRSSLGSKGHHGLVASQTARKIMESLGGLSSPLANARKLPMRATPLLGETQLAKRRRVSFDTGMASGNDALSPPPVSPLRTSSQHSHSNMETQIVPSEKSTRSRQHQPPFMTSRITDSFVGRVDSGPPAPASTKVVVPPPPPSTALPSSLSSSSFPTLSSSSRGDKPIFTVPNFSSTQPPKPSAILSGLKFTAPPFSMKSVDHTEDQERNRSPPSDSQRGFNITGNNEVSPTFLSRARKGLGSGGGKMRTKHRRRGAPEGEEEEEEEVMGYVNPMTQPPAVGLTLGKGGTLPKFLFHTQLPTSKDPAPTIQASMATPPSLSTNITPTPSFAFSAPKSVASESGPPPAAEQFIKPAATFNFSAPKDHSLTPSPPPPSSSSSTNKPLTTTFKPSIAPTLNSLPKPSPFPPSSTLSITNRLKEQPKGVQPSTAPLKAMSVEEALKSPEFQLPLSKTAVKAPAPLTKPAKQGATVCIDLTDSDDENASEPKPAAASAGQGIAKVGSGGLQLGNNGGLQLGSGGLKLGNSGGLQLGSNSATTGMSTICGATSVLPVKLGAPVSASGPSTSTTLKLKTTDSTSGVPPLKPLSQFAPQLGSWECDQCLVRNQAKDDKCVACSAPRPSSKTTDTTKSSVPSFKPLAQFAPPSDSWECGQCMVQNQAKDDKCVACTAPKPSVSKATTTDTKSTAPPPVFFKSLTQFAPPSGSWECDQCMVNNKATDRVCVACGAPKPVKTDSTSVSGASKPSGSVASSLGAPADLETVMKQPAGSWSCEVCLVQNKAEDSKCIACTAPKPAGKPASSETPPTSTAAKWTCSTCLVVNKAEDTKCVACSGPKVAKPSPAPPSLSSDPKSQKMPSSIAPLTGFAPPAGSWACDTCLVQNKAEDTKCVSCSTPKPGAKPVSESDSDSMKNSTFGGLTMGASGGLKLGGGLTLSGANFGQGGLKLLGSGGKESQDPAAGGVSGGIKITASLSSLVQGKNDKSAPESKQGGTSGSGFIGLSSLSGPAQASTSSGSGQVSIPQLAEKNPLAGIKFGVAATSTAFSQNPLAGIKFGAPTATTSTSSTAAATSSLQTSLGTASNSSSLFKLGSGVTAVGEQSASGGLKIGGALSSGPSSSMDMGGTQQAAAPKLGGMLSGVQPAVSGASAANPLGGLKFGVPATQLSSTSGSTKLQLPGQPQLQFAAMAASTASSSGLFGLSSSTATTSTSSQSFTFASTASGLAGSTPSPFVFSGATKPADSSNNKPPLIQFGALPATQTSQLQPPAPLNSMLGSTTSTSTTTTSSSLFVFSGSKDTSKIDSNSPFPSGGSASGSLGAFGASGGMGMGTGLGGGTQPLKLNFGASQPASNQPFIFGGSSSGGAVQSQGLSLTGQQPSAVAAPGLTLPQQTQGSSIFGAQSNQQQQPQFSFGSTTQQQPPPSTFNFSAVGSGGNGMGSTPNPNPNVSFPPSNTGGLNFAAPHMTSQGTGLGAVIGQQNSSGDTNSKQLQQGFQFNPNAGVNFNFGGGQGVVGSGDAGSGMLFSAGSSQTSASSSTTRIIKKARRRVK